MISPKQKQFCKEYLIDHNGTRAAIRAGYSKKTARAQASMLLDKPHVAAYLAQLTKGRDMDLTITAERVLKEIARIAFADPSSYFVPARSGHGGGPARMKDMDELTPDQRAAVAEFDMATKKFKLYDKLNALEKLGKHLKLFTELHEQQLNFTVMPELKLNGTVLVFNVGLPKGKK